MANQMKRGSRQGEKDEGRKVGREEGGWEEGDGKSNEEARWDNTVRRR